VAMFDEMYSDDAQIRKHYLQVNSWLRTMSSTVISQKNFEAESHFKRIGITFSVKDDDMTERIIPFDLIPRILTNYEWVKIEKGVLQRAKALNSFLHDIYNSGEIFKAGIVPKEIVYKKSSYDQSMINFSPPRKIYSPIIGVDLVRTGKDEFYVLEDNCRTPSGVSYMLENREIMMKMFPDLFHTNRVLRVDDYPTRLLQTLMSLAPKKCDSSIPTVVLLTPGHLNSAYYEHTFLSDQMGIEMVESQDLFVENDLLYMKTVDGPKKIDVVYRRIDDEFLDPLCYNPDSVIGVPGITQVYKTGGVNICSAPGAGIADDKAIYIFVPEMIKFYLGETPILDNVETWRCERDDELTYVLENIEKLVVKEVDGSGGYGMLIGPKSTKDQISEFSTKLKSNPRGYIAQPTLDLSSSPTLIDNEVSGRRVDLRPFCLVGEKVQLCPGGLTRVALNKGSYVVNSSQGGGVKDTWVLAD
tara:strand:+ start:185 stop:1597 length:1413 start_codon:yes stop_codon:yes gene_type:complete